jgi:FAD/FMN-containing dehydrogenase
MENLSELQRALGANVVKIGEEAFAPRHLKDFCFEAPPEGRLLGVAYPSSTEEVSKIMRWCAGAGVRIVPQGGMTGLVGGGVPVAPSLAVSMERMRAIEEIDAASACMIVQAGVTLENVQKAADEAGFFFPLDLGGRGTAQVGGNASTNAGGNRVLRYGMMRDLILGLEVVLPDGAIMTSLNRMLKNNAGYDLKHLFIGSEGTLGIITRLVLRLHPKARSVCTALCALKDYDAVVALLQRAKTGFAGGLSAYEVMWPDFYRIGTSALGRKPPIPEEHGLYVLMETLGGDPEADQARFEAVIDEAMQAGVVETAVVAQSAKDTQGLWSIRDCPGEFTKAGHWPQLGFDVSIPTGKIGAFVAECRRLMTKEWPGSKTLYFGHVADSNLHVSVRIDDATRDTHAIEEAVFALVGEWKGSISAEHGIGVVKREFLHLSRTPEELALMRTLKAALDPKAILNPGKVI